MFLRNRIGSQDRAISGSRRAMSFLILVSLFLGGATAMAASNAAVITPAALTHYAPVKSLIQKADWDDWHRPFVRIFPGPAFPPAPVAPFYPMTPIVPIAPVAPMSYICQTYYGNCTVGPLVIGSPCSCNAGGFWVAGQIIP